MSSACSGYDNLSGFNSLFSFRNQLFVRSGFLLDSCREISLKDLHVGQSTGTLPVGNAYAGAYESELDGKRGIAWIYAGKECKRALAAPLRGGELLVLGVSDPEAFLRMLRSPSAEFDRMRLAGK